MSTNELPTLRWGILGTGKISQWFVTDLLQQSWPSKRANHTIQSIGASSLQKSQDFVTKHMGTSPTKPTCHGSYADVYADNSVDCIYIGLPHAMHKQACLDAIAAGKHVLCEKPFMLNLAETKEVFNAAREKGVFVMEGMWTRFFPLVGKLRGLLHEEKVLGDVYRTFVDFGRDREEIEGLPEGSYVKDARLGGGSLLDVGVYSLNWGILTLQDSVGDKAEDPEVASFQTVKGGVDVASSFLIHYPSTGRQGILSSTIRHPGKARQPFCRIEGEKGVIEVEGMPSGPDAFVVKVKGKQEERFEFKRPGFGFFWEADAVAVAIHEGRKEAEIMPWRETERVMEILEGVRKRGGARFPVDEW